MELACRTYGNDTTALLATVLKGVKAVVCEACSVFNSIYSENSTFVVEFVVSEITLTHFVSVRSPVKPGMTVWVGSPVRPGMMFVLFAAEVCYRVVEERLLEALIHYILEEVAFVALGVTHLTEDLAVLADDSFDCVVRSVRVVW